MVSHPPLHNLGGIIQSLGSLFPLKVSQSHIVGHQWIEAAHLEGRLESLDRRLMLIRLEKKTSFVVEGIRSAPCPLVQKALCPGKVLAGIEDRTLQLETVLPELIFLVSDLLKHPQSFSEDASLVQRLGVVESEKNFRIGNF